MKTFSLVCIISLALVGIQCPAGADPGDLDLSFDAGAGLNGVVFVAAMQADGKVLIGGQFTTIHGESRAGLARLNADGSMDPSFLAGLASGGNGSPFVHALAVQADQKILVGGQFTSINGASLTNLARLNSDGSVDATFRARVGTGDAVWQLAAQTDGRILVSGGFSSINGATRTNLARLNADGTLDDSFRADLTSYLSSDRPANCLAVQTDGKILIGGSFCRVNGLARTNLARLNADGALDTSFLQGLAGPLIADPQSWMYAQVSGLALQSDGKMVITGTFTSVNGAARTNLARLNADGSVDESFLPNIAISWQANPTLALQADGRIVLGANYNPVCRALGAWLARFNADGTLDTSFTAGLTPLWDTAVFCLLATPDGKLFAGGGFEYSTRALSERYFCRINPDGSLDGSFNTGPTGPSDEVLRVAAQPDGRLLVGGRFDSVNGSPRGHLATVASSSRGNSRP